MKKYKYLVVNGCSFVKGGSTFIKGTDEMNNPLSREEREELSFSRLLSKRMNCVEHNLAHPGSGNQRIVRTTFDFINKNKELKNKTLIIIGLTQISRMEVFLDGEIRKIRLGAQQSKTLSKHWITSYKNKELERWLKTYIKYFYDESWEIKQLNRNLVFLQTFVEKKGFDIIFFSSILELDEREQGHIWSNYNLKLDDIDKLNFFKFPNNKLSWRDSMDISGHPNEDDHKILSSLLYKYIKENFNV